MAHGQQPLFPGDDFGGEESGMQEGRSQGRTWRQSFSDIGNNLAGMFRPRPYQVNGTLSGLNMPGYQAYCANNPSRHLGPRNNIAKFTKNTIVQHAVNNDNKLEPNSKAYKIADAIFMYCSQHTSGHWTTQRSLDRLSRIIEQKNQDGNFNNLNPDQQLEAVAIEFIRRDAKTYNPLKITTQGRWTQWGEDSLATRLQKALGIKAGETFTREQVHNEGSNFGTSSSALFGAPAATGRSAEAAPAPSPAADGGLRR